MGAGNSRLGSAIYIIRHRTHETPDLGVRPSIKPAATPLLENANLLSHFNVICPVQTYLKKYSAFAVGQISGFSPRVSPT
jgi:hypothetical protein